MESQESFYQLSDPDFRGFLYKALKTRIENIEDRIYTHNGEKQKQLELENYQNYSNCIQSLEFNEYEKLSACQVEFQKKNVLTYVQSIVERSKDSLYECMNDKYLHKESKSTDESRIHGCLDKFESKIYSVFDSI